GRRRTDPRSTGWMHWPTAGTACMNGWAASSGVRPGSARPSPELEAEPWAGYLFRDPGAVQVGRDPAQVERPAGAQDHTQVDVLGPGHEALVEHQPDLLGQRLAGPLAALLRRGRPVTAGQQRRDRLVDGEVGPVDGG